MPTLNIDGVGRVTVDDSFTHLSPEDQQKTVDDIIATVKSPDGAAVDPENPGPDPSEAPSNSGSLQANTSPGFLSRLGSSLSGMGHAAAQSIIHGLPAALAGGSSALIRTAENKAGHVGLVDDAANALQSLSDDQRADLAQNYQHPADVDPSPVHALKTQGVGGFLKSLGYSTAEGAGPLGATLALGAAAPVTGGASLIPMLGMQGMLAADNVQQSKKAAGLETGNGLTNTDLANAAGQTALYSLGGPEANILKGMINTGAKGSIASLMDSASNAYQGSPIENVGGAYQKAADAFLTGALTHAGVTGAKATAGVTAQTAQRAVDPARAGKEFVQSLPEVKPYVADRNKWIAANNEAFARIKQANPDMNTGEALDAARSYVQRQGISAPESLSPEGSRSLGALNFASFFGPLRAAGSKDNPETELSDTVKGDLDNGKANMVQLFKSLRQLGPENGGVDKDQHTTLMNALKEATNHNRNQADNGEDNGYLDTFRDQINDMVMPEQTKAAILDRLQTLNIGAYNGKKMNAGGTTGRALRAIMTAAVPALSGTAVGHFAGAEGGIGAATGMAAGLNYLRGRALANAATSVGGRVDSLLGLGTPPVLKAIASKQRVAARAGVGTSVDPSLMQGLADDAAVKAALSGRAKQATAARVMGSRPAPRPAAQAAQATPTQPGQGASQGPSTSGAGPAEGPDKGPSKGPSAPPHPTSSVKATIGGYPGWLTHVASTSGDAGGVNPADVKHFIMNMHESRGGALTDADINSLLSPNAVVDPSVMNGLREQISEHVRNGTWAKATGRATPSQGASQGPSVVRNPQSYQAAIDQAVLHRDQIIKQYPHLRDAAMAVATGKSPDERGALLAAELQKIADPTAQREALIALAPLTQYGKKG